MSLIMPYEKMWDMPLGGISKEKQIPHWFGNLVYIIIGGLCKIIFRYKTINRDSLRALYDQTGAVVICNHSSYLDVVFMYLVARPRQWIRLIGRDSLFPKGHGILGQMLSRVGAFPIKRDSSDRTAIKRAARDLKNRELVGIYPEGTRRGKGNKKPTLHSGAAFIAKMGGSVPILPMTVRNVDKIKQKGKRLRFPKITIVMGDPILLGDFDFLPKEERMDACSWYGMRECFAMFHDIAPEEVDMAALFPDTKDYTDLFAEHSIPRHTSEEIVAALTAKRAASGTASTQDTSDAKGIE